MSEQALQLRQVDSISEWQVIREQCSMLVKTGFLPPSIKTAER